MLSNLPRTVALSFRGVCLASLVLAMVTGLSIGGYDFLSRRAHDSKVRAELPQFCRALAQQRDRLTAAISRYRKAKGFYPPDHLLTATPVRVDPSTNQLFYELVGCGYDPVQQAYVPGIGSVRLPQTLLRRLFGRDITNVAELPGVPPCFLPSAGTEPLLEIHEKPQSVALITYWPNWDGFDGDLSGFQIGSWQYNSSAPEHNPGSYDLWLELKTARTNIVIRNW